MEGFNNQKDIYLNFYKLSNHSKVRYYEEYVQKNFNLTIDEKIELEIEYIFALFEIGKYERVLANIDSVIEKVIYENIENHNGQDAYLGLLFKKAASFYNLDNYDAAINLSHQLIKIKPNVPLYSHLLQLAQRKKKHAAFNAETFMGIICVSLSMILYILDIFIVDPFFHHHHQRLVYLFQGLMVLGLVRIIHQSILYLIKKYA